MKKFIAAVSLFACGLLYQESAFANTLCLDKVRLAYVNTGFVDGSIASADMGNGIYFGYYDSSGNIRENRINIVMNLNDGTKGFAMYHALSTALTMGLDVNGWDHDATLGQAGTCNDIDEIRIWAPK